MKKLFIFVAVITLSLTLSGCSKIRDAREDANREKLYVLNWGEYMDMDLVEEFEDEYNVTVVYDEAPSNEQMEVRIKSGKTPYDIAIPSDYMIDKLRQQNLLQEIDYTKLTELDNVSFKTEVTELYSNKGYSQYLVPYFWGTIGIMYNTDTVLEADLTGWDVLFEGSSKYQVGMYDSSRDAVAAALLYLGYDVNTAEASELAEAEQALKDGNFAEFSDDALKGRVIEGNLDLALVYSGDYFDELYAFEEDEIEPNFGYFVPDVTNIWVDAFVIPTTSENTDMAYNFINFFLREEVAETNADWVGYAPVISEVYDTLVGEEYGYDYDNYNPKPEGSSRVIYEFISNERFDLLDQILNAVKADSE